MTADGWEDAPRPALEHLHELDEVADRAVLVPALPRAQVVSSAGALGVPGWVVPDAGGSGRVFFVGALTDAVAVSVLCTAGRADPPAVVLWLDCPGALPTHGRAGVVLVHRRQVMTGHQWPEEEGSLVGDAAELAEIIGTPGVEVGLRALLRRRDRPPAELLAELVDLTGLPRQALVLLTTVALPADADVLAARPRQGTLATARSDSRALPEPGWLASVRRWQWLFPAAVSLYFTARAVLAAAAGIGEPGDDVGYTVLAVISSCAAMFWGWRGRRGRRPG